MKTFAQAVSAGQVTLAEALAIYDSLEPVSIDFMLGNWQGGEFPTGHPLDGFLGASGWYGKQFKDAESVHPLLYRTADGRSVFAVNPQKLLAGPGGDPRKPADRQAEVETKSYKARLRMTEFRGKLSATMIYDERPINDIFRKVDDRTVLGVMDSRGLPQLFFFVLRRDDSVAMLG